MKFDIFANNLDRGGNLQLRLFEVIWVVESLIFGGVSASF